MNVGEFIILTGVIVVAGRTRCGAVKFTVSRTSDPDVVAVRKITLFEDVN